MCVFIYLFVWCAGLFQAVKATVDVLRVAHCAVHHCCASLTAEPLTCLPTIPPYSYGGTFKELKRGRQLSSTRVCTYLHTVLRGKAALIAL